VCDFYQGWALLHISVVSWLILFKPPKGTSPMFNLAANQLVQAGGLTCWHDKDCI